MKAVLENGKDSDDKLHVHLCRILALADTTYTAATIAYCIGNFQSIRATVSSQSKHAADPFGYMKTKRKFSLLSDDEI